MNYRSIWISDVHMGSRHAQTGPLLDFLRHHRCRHLYHVGDIVDGWELRRRWLWNAASNTVIQKLLRIQRKETKVIFIYGNHDEFLRQFIGLSVGGVRVVEQVIHVGPDRRRYLVIHGHQLDGLVHFNRLLERVGSRLYDKILLLNTQFNRLRRRLGFGYWSVSSYLKHNTKSAVRYITGFEGGMVRLAQKHRVQGVICGHIHRAEQRQIQGLNHLNCGDWVESCTALVEDFEGRFQILHWQERGTNSEARPTPVDQPPLEEFGLVDPSKTRRRRPAGRYDSEPELAGLF
jgi:UDP-2,3-diacylglucosamine pyrophosphatase LpxH